jgi:Ni,Fe-hydrogenase III small subunit/Pyruvate/2-oxoacid:ferredoxin oxidoreductase delta subunit
MWKILKTRFQQGHRTGSFPKGKVELAGRYRGLPELHSEKCPAHCNACTAVCPTGAIQNTPDGLRLDMGKCLFCPACERACPAQAIAFGSDYRLAMRKREDGIIDDKNTFALAKALDKKSRKLFGRSLKLRQVSAGGCNACEADVNVLNTLVFDLGRFGIQFVASPRHADGLLITGPVTNNMKLALQKTYEAVPDPKIVIVAGTCAISGGPFIDQPETHNGAASILPIDLFVPGCPPHPYTILDGLLRLLHRCS